jgi:hypothetical protein
MPSVTEGSFTYSFPKSWDASKYDDTAFYRNHFQHFAGGTKAVDVLAISNGAELWLIEQKDYRLGATIKCADLFGHVALKVLHTLACLVSTRSTGSPGTACFTRATNALAKPNIRCALHVEQPQHHSKLFPQVIDPKTAHQKFKQQMKAVDHHPLVGDKNHLNTKVPWVII